MFICINDAPKELFRKFPAFAIHHQVGDEFLIMENNLCTPHKTSE